MTIKPNLSHHPLIPRDPEQLRIWLYDFYKDVKNIVNTNDSLYFSLNITSTAQDIPNISTYGSFIILCSGVISSMPTNVSSLSKSSESGAGAIATLSSQVGITDWAAVNLTITSTATNYQIAHSGAATLSGDFYIKVIASRGIDEEGN